MSLKKKNSWKKPLDIPRSFRVFSGEIHGHKFLNYLWRNSYKNTLRNSSRYLLNAYKIITSGGPLLVTPRKKMPEKF